MEWKTIIAYAATVFLTHHIASFIQASLHCLIGHREFGRSLYRNHLYHHHGIYSQEFLVSEKYIPEEKNLDIYYLIPSAGVLLLAYQLLAVDLFIVHLSSLALSVYLHIYLHTQYHMSDSWLMRFHWFRSKRQLHILHHKDLTKNFAVIEFFWDKILGTYEGTQIPGTSLEAQA